MDIPKGCQDLNRDEMNVQAEENEQEMLQQRFSSSVEIKVLAEVNERDLLNAGFTLSGDGDLMCSACFIQVQGDFANMNRRRFLDMHIMMSPFCPIVEGIINGPKGDAHPPPPSRETRNTSGEPQECSGFFHPPARHPNFSNRTDRERSFDGYNGPIQRNYFIDAGFFLNPPPSDKTTCFWCDGSLEGWNEGEQPGKKHAKYYPGCGYLRQVIGPDEIYNIRAQMTHLERQAAESVMHGHDREVLYEYYRAYRDKNTRVRSLVAGGFSDDVAASLAFQGFHFNDERHSVQCYYCGLHVNKRANLTNMSEIHIRMSPLCKMVRDGGDRHPHASQGDTEEYLVCEPCGCFIIASEYDPSTRLCPKLNCRAEVTRVEPYRTRRIISPQQ